MLPRQLRTEEEEVWINLTTGTWPSPFFLFWADSIWRGGPDIATRPREWYGPLKISDRLLSRVYREPLTYAHAAALSSR